MVRDAAHFVVKHLDALRRRAETVQRGCLQGMASAASLLTGTWLLCPSTKVYERFGGRRASAGSHAAARCSLVKSSGTLRGSPNLPAVPSSS